ncbi:MAG: LamG-like jellyroll fold domain-containing protein, partial [Actinomycetota bacterium]
TAYVTSSENDSDGYTLIYDWRKNGISDAVLNMPFDVNGSNGNTSNVKDYTTNSSNGTKIINSTNPGAIWNASCGAFTGSGGCYKFDGLNDYISIPGGGAALNLTNKVTVSAWVKADGFAKNYRSIAGRTNDNNWGYGWGLMYAVSQLRFWINGYSTNVATAAFSDTTSWHHVTGIYDGTTISIYIDGAKGTDDAYSGNIDNRGTLEIGRNADYEDATQSLYWNGSIDQVQIWNRSLSASEIAMYYNNAVGMYNRTHSDATTNGDVWYVVVTRADKYEDGTPVASNNVTIRGCGDTISTAGETYTLTTNISATGTCLTIGADNVTVNCNGHSLIGDCSGSTDYGVTTVGRNNVTVRNCMITCFGDGVHFEQTNTSLIRNNTIHGNERGIGILFNSTNNTISGNAIYNSTSSEGILISGELSDYNNISYNRVYNNTENQIDISGGRNNTISRNNISDYNNANPLIFISKANFTKIEYNNIYSYAAADGGNGINIYGANATIYRNMISIT